MTEHSETKIRRDDLLPVVRDLNAIVVSLDRLGSRAAEGSRADSAEALLDFVQKWDVGPKLIRLRRVLVDALDAESSSEEERERLYDLIDSGPYWPDTESSARGDT